MTEAFQETRNVFDEKITHLSRKVKDKNGFGENLESVSMSMHYFFLYHVFDQHYYDSISMILTTHRGTIG